MTGSIKLAIAGACSIGAGSVGLVGSNYATMKETSIKITNANSKEWDAKVATLFTKIKENDPANLKTKIAVASTNHAQSLDLNTDSTDFLNKEKAKVALQAWCTKTDTNNKELCETTKKQGWLF